MILITKPAFTVREVFHKCISTVADEKLKQELEDCIDLLELAETDFDKKFILDEIYMISPKNVIKGNIDKNEMKKIYDYRMVSIIPGKTYYNRIMSAAPYGKCPLCSVRLADTLDHYLPKSKFPIYTVTPINLIPACTLCNQGKRVDYPTTSEGQTLHPYYDNVENVSWIQASVLHTNPITFNYSVVPHYSWTKILKDRAQTHFNAFNLNELFSSHANEEFRGVKMQLITLYNSNPNLLKAHLQDSYKSRLALGRNSWQAVMYNALLNDVWFCNGGILA